VNYFEQPPSTQWAALKYKGEKLAEVWFKPEGEPFGLTFRIRQESFHIPGVGHQLTIASLLMAVGITPEDVESCRHGSVSQSGMAGTNLDLRSPLAPPSQEVAHLDLQVRMKPPQATAGNERSAPEITSEMWQDLEAHWKAILGLEATMDTLRISMEGLLADMQASLTKTLTFEEKLHALRADVAQWTKAKVRVHHALPKMKEYIHRSIWVMGTPEKKQLEEIYKNHIQPQIPTPQMDKVLEQLEYLQKNRQILSAHGTTVYHDCKAISADVQRALRTLQGNAAVNAQKKKGAAGVKGKFFKDLRRWSGAD
jgi:hypothetical protein